MNVLHKTFFLTSILGGYDRIPLEQSVHVYSTRLVRLLSLFHNNEDCLPSWLLSTGIHFLKSMSTYMSLLFTH